MIIGLTGGIGSGKSTIAHALERYGMVLYDTDSRAKQLLQSNSSLITQVKRLLGDDCYDEHGTYLTAIVATRVFEHPNLLKQLNAIVHPAVQQDILNSHNARQVAHDTRHTLVESAILFESGLHRICDKTIAVTAPEHLRIERTILRDHTNENKVRARMQAQMGELERNQSADIVVCNDGTKTIDELCLYITQHL
ncbi:MAG: dephospho-CoA kinase [Paludibacteraceae bacterium]|nr:dephospho-CoA kinase [Paludibacteraceae bacterium]